MMHVQCLSLSNILNFFVNELPELSYCCLQILGILKNIVQVEEIQFVVQKSYSESSTVRSQNHN